MDKTISGDRLHIAVFGRRNAGKSSIINAIFNREVAIVSDIPGTTTDPVSRAMELAPIGPVLFIDTPGLDEDEEGLGKERKRKAYEILEKTNLALLVVDVSANNFTFEDELILKMEEKKIPYLIIGNKIDLKNSDSFEYWKSKRRVLMVSALKKTGIDELKKEISEKAPADWEPPFLKDLINPQDLVLLVVPIDLGAPRGRLIMPQIKALRDILDADAIAIICKERELPTTLRSIEKRPALVITDSQVFPQVAADVPQDIMLTSFSILSARQKGELDQLVEAVLAVKNLKTGDRVLVIESCAHHPLEDDIGRVKIPRWLNQYAGGGLKIETVAGGDQFSDYSGYKLVVHCGGCTINRLSFLKRQYLAKEQKVAFTNYGILIAFLKGVFPRALQPFKNIYERFYKAENYLKKNYKQLYMILSDIN